MEVLDLMDGFAPMLSWRSQVVLADNGLRLDRGQLERIDAARRDALAACERVEFAPGIVDELVSAFADSPFLGQEGIDKTLSEVFELFYALRSDVPVDVPDDDVLAAVRKSFDSVEGDVDAIDAPTLACELMVRESQLVSDAIAERGKAADVSDVYRIADDEGRVYCWSTDWDYDEFAPGWDGERWDDDLE